MPARFRRPSSTTRAPHSARDVCVGRDRSSAAAQSVIDPFAGFETARKIEEGGIVLLKNEKATLP